MLLDHPGFNKFLKEISYNEAAADITDFLHCELSAKCRDEIFN